MDERTKNLLTHSSDTPGLQIPGAKRSAGSLLLGQNRFLGQVGSFDVTWFEIHQVAFEIGDTDIPTVQLHEELSAHGMFLGLPVFSLNGQIVGDA